MADSIYEDGTLNARDKLGMVNICLQAIGEVDLEPGTVLSELQPGTDGARARDLVSKAMLEVQNEGFFFNTDYDFEFTPDENGFISAPPNLLRVDAGRTENKSKIILQDGLLYNNETQDNIFTNSIKADAIWIVNYDKLPYSAWYYIATVAARKFEQSIMGSPDLGRNALQNEAIAREKLMKEHMRYKDTNLIK